MTRSEQETVALGEAIGRALAGGELLALIGELGTGKTHLIQGMARGLGAAQDGPVTSPTFVLINEYVGRVRLYHVDAYRLEGPGQLAALGFEEMVETGGVTVVEWADRVWPLVAVYGPIRIDLEHVAATQRRIRFENASGSLAAAVQVWRAGQDRWPAQGIADR